MKINEKINGIRKLMKSNNIAAVIIPSDDPHKSEYLAKHFQARKWLTGFSGSAGTAVVTLDTAILWTDFRYYIQAEKQIAGSFFKLYKMGEPDVPSFEKYLTDTLKPGDTIGIDANIFSMSSVKKYKTQFEGKGLLLDAKIDFIKELWKDRPQMPVSKAFSFSSEYAGKKRKDKISEIRQEMQRFKASYHLMATLDDIAWTLNLRGKDVHANPVNIAFVLFAPEKLSLFINREKVDADLENRLSKDDIEIFAYHEISKALSEIPKGETVLLDPENTNYKLSQAIHKECKIIEKPNPAIALKAVKNDIEIAHLKKTAVKDGVAMVNFLYWLELQKKNPGLTEVSVADKLLAFRKQQDLFVDNSFDPIMAFQDHSAMCHYSATKDTDVIIDDNGMFLTDSGGNYLTGTTDITRTIHRGKPGEQEILDYTLVLKGHICVATSFFPKGARGFQIDTLARQYLWQQGMDFGHGTGHGVGFFLCVHEGPARISPHPLDVKLEQGMVLTNEPGVYREGAYGIRLENMILVDQAFENEFGTFMKFENLTYCHFERDLMDMDLLTPDEKKWINSYHAAVFEKLSPGLDNDTVSWLKEKTRAV